MTDEPGEGDTPNKEERGAEARSETLSGHILSASAALIGACLTVIGLFRVVFHLKNADSIADNLLACAALLFLVSGTAAYMALRSGRRGVRERWERTADVVFLFGLVVLVVVGGLIAYEVI
jgi:hypothetical protein